VLFSSSIVAVCTQSYSAKSQWYRCGYLTRRVRLPGVGLGFGSDSTDSGDEIIPLNRCTLLQFPKDLPQYEIFFTPVPWLKDFNFALWEYTGEQGDSTEELIQTLKVDIARLESKIDQL